jgi:cytochrome d ubiquinol oxidase subunit I
MSNVDLARWQFAFTSINQFLFVSITIGLAFLTALLQTAWCRSKRDEYLRLMRFFGTLLVINVAIGVVTGLVQEFEFRMNWRAYSRLVGNIFGAPLAMEGLGAFFPESTFLGLWLFGWDKLPRRSALVSVAEKLTAQELPWIPDVQPTTVLPLGKGLTGAVPSSAYTFTP